MGDFLKKASVLVVTSVRVEISPEVRTINRLFFQSDMLIQIDTR